MCPRDVTYTVQKYKSTVRTKVHGLRFCTKPVRNTVAGLLNVRSALFVTFRVRVVEPVHISRMKGE